MAIDSGKGFRDGDPVKGVLSFACKVGVAAEPLPSDGVFVPVSAVAR